jgi:hypothetical protein
MQYGSSIFSLALLRSPQASLVSVTRGHSLREDQRGDPPVGGAANLALGQGSRPWAEEPDLHRSRALHPIIKRTDRSAHETRGGGLALPHP